ncbi:hypothetical protein [Nocardia sp. NPDC003963]
MIVVPSVLTDLLWASEPDTCRSLSLDFGSHALDACADICTGELFEAAHACIAAARRVSAVDTAGTAQAAVGRYAAHRAASTIEGPDERAAARSARWEEARWQLIRVIEVAPRPPEGREECPDRG